MTYFVCAIEIGPLASPIAIQFNTTGQSYFYKGLNIQANTTTNGITNSNGISNTGGIISDSLSIDSGKLSLLTNGSDQIAYKSITTGVRDAGIEFSSNFNPFFLTDTGIINIGNADQTSIVYINGMCYFTNPVNFTSFMNQFA